MAFVAATNNRGNASISPSVAFPASISANDILLLLVTRDDLGSNATWTGFTSLGVQQITFDGQTYQVLWKRATGTESGTLSAGSAATGDWEVGMLQHSGRDTGNPPVLGAFNVNNTGSAATSISTTATAITALAGDDLVFFCCPDPNNTNMITGDTPPSGYTSRIAAPTTGQQFCWVQADTLDNASAGSTGTVSASFGSTGGSNSVGWGTVLIRIPAAGGAAASIPDLIMAPFHR